MNTPIALINSAAPIRVCDNGGWSDTWFAEYGRIFNIAVSPFAEVQIAVYPRAQAQNGGRVTIHAENFGDTYTIDPTSTAWNQHPLLEAAINMIGVPEQVAIEITIYSDAPSGASTGSSAAVTVALIAALDRLRNGQMAAYEIARAAQRVETEMLGLQCGIQDQLCAAYGGINYIDMHAYPNATVSQLNLSETIWHELERRLVLIYLGNSHNSSQVHEMVIRDLENAGSADKRIEALRETAVQSRDALSAGDFVGLGKAMLTNTAAQANLHSELISPDAQRIIEIAQAHGAVGWKVNGAGGNGGSLTLLCDQVSHTKRAMIRDIMQENELFQHIPTRLSRRGVRTWIRPSQTL